MARLTRFMSGVALALGGLVAYEYFSWQPRRLDGLYRGAVEGPQGGLGRPRLLLGHRGAAAEAPENTLTSFHAALAAGADGVELDVHRTRDGAVVVIHDDTVSAVAGQPGRVAEMTLAEIQRLDAGSHFAPAFAGERIPTLGEALEAVGPQTVVNIELKGVSARADGLEREVARIVREHRMEGRVIVSSFNPLRLIRLRRLAPALPRAMLYAPDMPIFVRDLWLLPFVHPDALHPAHEMIDAAFMAQARRWGVRVNAWTVDDPAEARRLVALGVDGIITNDPRKLREVV